MSANEDITSKICCYVKEKIKVIKNSNKINDSYNIDVAFVLKQNQMEDMKNGDMKAIDSVIVDMIYACGKDDVIDISVCEIDSNDNNSNVHLFKVLLTLTNRNIGK